MDDGAGLAERLLGLESSSVLEGSEDAHNVVIAMAPTAEVAGC